MVDDTISRRCWIETNELILISNYKAIYLILCFLYSHIYIKILHIFLIYIQFNFLLKCVFLYVSVERMKLIYIFQTPFNLQGTISSLKSSLFHFLLCLEPWGELLNSNSKTWNQQGMGIVYIERTNKLFTTFDASLVSTGT